MLILLCLMMQKYLQDGAQGCIRSCLHQPETGMLLLHLLILYLLLLLLHLCLQLCIRREAVLWLSLDACTSRLAHPEGCKQRLNLPAVKIQRARAVLVQPWDCELIPAGTAV